MWETIKLAWKCKSLCSQFIWLGLTKGEGQKYIWLDDIVLIKTANGYKVNKAMKSLAHFKHIGVLREIYTLKGLFIQEYL